MSQTGGYVRTEEMTGRWSRRMPGPTRTVEPWSSSSMVFKRCVCVDLNSYCIYKNVNSNRNCGPSGLNGMTNIEDSRMHR